MSFIDNLFVFSEAVKANGRLKCNIDGDSYTFHYRTACHTIRLSSLPPDSATLLLYDHLSDSFIEVRHWDDLVSQAGVTSPEALRILRRASFFQADYFNGEYFIKIFLPLEQMVLDSDTHDFSLYSCFPVDYFHPLDRQYSITHDVLRASVRDGELAMELEIVPSVLPRQRMYLTYGDRTVPLSPGRNSVVLPYRQGQRVHFGDKPYFRGVSNSLKVEDYL